ncbi:hypothetical protein VVT58_06430 [Sphingobium sp. SJ10-10]|uniref:hypothetical protein n=1 Tax=Sphingobium sp. SJ10-10 TaxID=3114999 RepID=UPI002E16E242|nr:hypothetical protein [Sphingobium sp. SJ10-10]
MKDENSMVGLTSGYADADQSENIRLSLVQQNRQAVEAKIKEIEAQSLALEAKVAAGEISAADLKRHQDEIGRAHKRLAGNLRLLELYVSQLEQVEN